MSENKILLRTKQNNSYRIKKNASIEAVLKLENHLHEKLNTNISNIAKMTISKLLNEIDIFKAIYNKKIFSREFIGV